MSARAVTVAEQAPERTEASRPPKGRKILGMTQGQLLIVAGIALAGGAFLLWRRRKAQAAQQDQGATATGGGGGSGTCPDGSTADCAGLCPDGSTPQGCPDYSGQLSTLQSEIGNLQSGAAQGAGGGGDGGTIPPAVPGQPGTTPAPSPAPAAGGWAFPAPAVQAHNVSKTGYRLSWQPVTGPGGQKPVSYTIQTTQLNGKKVDQFNTRSTSTAEYGLGGKGLHPGWSYKTEVWANGSPRPSPHSTVQVALKR